MRFIPLFAFLFFTLNVVAQEYAIRHGVSVPARDTVRVLMIFAELDFEDGPCPQNLPDFIEGNWPKDKAGKTQVPEDADTFFEPYLKPGQEPQGYITDYYRQASFGEYVLLGDYYPEVITIPCKEARIGSPHLYEVLEKLNEAKPAQASLTTKNGFTLKDFDSWTLTSRGQPKEKKPDGRIDLIYLIWKNNRFLTSSRTYDSSGFGVTATRGRKFKDMDGVNNMASFNAGHGGQGAFQITIAEHLHGIFGGNHWHSAGGRGNHTFLAVPHSYGLTGQHPATMQAVSGWDRWMMHWKRPEKQFVTSAYDLEGKEVKTDDISIETFPGGGTFVLRDYVKSGDALRIKLPHINWQEMGDVKNQYLWIENRRMNTRFDEYLGSECSDDRQGRFPRGTPGIHAYIQVGKDIREGGSGIYSAAYEHPNGLASPFFPLTAEGNFDMHYEFDRIQEGQWIECNWNNKNIPLNPGKSVPNPFTGHSDLYQYIDSNNDGELFSGDNVQSGLSEVKGDTIVHNYNASGDWEDAFCYATGQMEISLSTNPAPVPVYTYTTNHEFRRFNIRDGKMPDYENRTIWLNGLSIEIIDENQESGEMTVRIQWDNYSIWNDVRWCGNIKLSPHDFDPEKPSLVLKPKNEIWLDRSRSPQFHKAVEKDKYGNWRFTEPTVFTCLPGSYFLMEEKSDLLLTNGSTLILKPGAKLVVGEKAKIKIERGSDLIVEDGAELVLKRRAKIVDKNE